MTTLKVSKRQPHVRADMLPAEWFSSDKDFNDEREMAIVLHPRPIPAPREFVTTPTPRRNVPPRDTVVEQQVQEFNLQNFRLNR